MSSLRLIGLKNYDPYKDKCFIVSVKLLASTGGDRTPPFPYPAHSGALLNSGVNCNLNNLGAIF